MLRVAMEMKMLQINLKAMTLSCPSDQSKDQNDLETFWL